DLDGDGDADQADRTFWVQDLSNTYFGDSDFNGEFNSGDFVAVFGTAKYETGQPATWAEGDWNGDGIFGSGDFVTAFAGGGYEGGPREGGLQTVPEPSSIVLLVCGLLGLVARNRR
ncbi:MAG: PEP-CTERM sorting domain-containing protein, partial [Planctomycetales bacterium]|nr:PEP-CTERM sorting domain-containing protein [Planctomycetales bacterium]